MPRLRASVGVSSIPAEHYIERWLALSEIGLIANSRMVS
jgi:hypothetical protein